LCSGAIVGLDRCPIHSRHPGRWLSTRDSVWPDRSRRPGRLWMGSRARPHVVAGVSRSLVSLTPTGTPTAPVGDQRRERDGQSRHSSRRVHTARTGSAGVHLAERGAIEDFELAQTGGARLVRHPAPGGLADQTLRLARRRPPTAGQSGPTFPTSRRSSPQHTGHPCWGHHSLLQLTLQSGGAAQWNSSGLLIGIPHPGLSRTPIGSSFRTSTATMPQRSHPRSAAISTPCGWPERRKPSEKRPERQRPSLFSFKPRAEG
jgi:hypothetical protein